MTERCPDCDSPHDSKAGVAQHMVMSNDHDYETRDEAWAALLGNESNQGEAVEPPDPERNEQSETTPEPEPDPETEPEGESNPVAEGPEPQNVDGGSEYPEDVRAGCPRCGEELVDFREVETVTREGRMFDTPDDYYCSECGQGFEWEES